MPPPARRHIRHHYGLVVADDRTVYLPEPEPGERVQILEFEHDDLPKPGGRPSGMTLGTCRTPHQSSAATRQLRVGSASFASKLRSGRMNDSADTYFDAWNETDGAARREMFEHWLNRRRRVD
jgi:hypothetical protein